MIIQKTILLPKYKRGIHCITKTITNKFNNLPKTGLANLFIKHTSAAIGITENYDSDVITDMNEFLNRLCPDTISWFNHTMEGTDDMPAHIKSSIIGVSINIPIVNNKFDLGQWQGIYLFEFRNNATPRTVIVTVIGEKE